MQRKKLSISLKILLAFILMVIPIYIISIYVTLKGQNSVRDELLKAAESKAEFYMSSMESQIYNVLRLELNVMNDENINILERPDINKSKVEQAMMLNNTRVMLRNIASMNSYIRDIAVFLPRIGKKVTTETILPLDFIEYEEYLRNASVENLPFCNIKGDYYINITPEFYSQMMPYKADRNLLLVSVQISREALGFSMERIVDVKGGGAFLTSENREIYVYSDESPDFANKSENILSVIPLNNEVSQRLNIGGVKYKVFSIPSSFLNSTLFVYMPENGLMQVLRSFNLWIWIVSALTVLLVLMFSLWIRGMVSQPLEKLIVALKQVEEGVVDVRVPYARDDEFGHIYKKFNQLVERLKELVADGYKKELMLKDAEFRQLQYQINPHFLYNSLLIAKGSIEMGYIDGAVKLIKHLSGYYKYITKGMPGYVTIDQEIEHVRDYIEVQNIRFDGRITCEIQGPDDDMKNIRVPRLILQPIVENAYKHGLKNKLSGGLLKVSFRRKENYIFIIIEDNGEELSDEAIEKINHKIMQSEEPMDCGTGMRNVHNRLRIHFGSDAGISAFRSELGGLMVKIILATGSD